MDPVIQFRNVFKAFGSHAIYEGMDLEIREGETLTVIGGSGQGKSVCMKMMIGLLYADEGEVLFRGSEVSELGHDGLRELRRKVSYVFQSGALFDSMNIRDNVGYALIEHTSMGDDEITKRAWECLDMVGLGQDRGDRAMVDPGGDSANTGGVAQFDHLPGQVGRCRVDVLDRDIEQRVAHRPADPAHAFRA